MHPPLQTFCTFFDGFLHHCLRLLHRTQFRRRVSDRSVVLAASYCSEANGFVLLARVKIFAQFVCIVMLVCWFLSYIYLNVLISSLALSHLVATADYNYAHIMAVQQLIIIKYSEATRGVSSSINKE